MPGSEAAGGKDTDPPSGAPVSAPSSAGLSPLSASPLGNYYIYSFDGKLLQVYDVYGTLLKDYIYMGERMIAEYDHVGSRLLYYTPDQINSTRVVTDQAGNVVYSAVHDPYGGIQLAGQNNTYDPQLKFSGKERDVESEFDYFGARYYDRSQYRFISVDPNIPAYAAAGDTQMWNVYTYCRGNPINYIDPDGRQTIEIRRYRYATNGTFGTFRVDLGDSTIWGYTLEPARGVGKGAISAGTYDANNYWWSKKGYQVLWLQGVPSFEGIFIHRGKVSGDSTGCIIVGMRFDSAGNLIDSKQALDRILTGVATYNANLVLAAIGMESFGLDYMQWILEKSDVQVDIADIALPRGEVTYTVVIH